MDFESEEFWCELVINGIGGRTIEEAKQKISPEEFKIWWAYHKKYGSFFFGKRVEQAVGRLHSDMVAIGIRKEQNPFHYMPHEVPPKEVEYSVDEMFEKGLEKLT